MCCGVCMCVCVGGGAVELLTVMHYVCERGLIVCVNRTSDTCKRKGPSVFFNTMCQTHSYSSITAQVDGPSWPVRGRWVGTAGMLSFSVGGGVE